MDVPQQPGNMTPRTARRDPRLSMATRSVGRHGLIVVISRAPSGTAPRRPLGDLST